jgi:DNA polymerase III alpha subunit
MFRRIHLLVLKNTSKKSKAIGKPIKVGGMIQTFRKVATKKGDMMAMITLEDPFGKIDCVMFPKTYAKNYNTLVEDHVMVAEGILEKRMGEFQIIINQAESLPLEDLQAKAKAEKLWTEGEKIERVSRIEVEEEEVAEAAEVMEAVETEPEATSVEEVSEVESIDEPIVAESTGEEPKKDEVYTITINRTVDKEFFMKLKGLLEKHPGSQPVELVIGEKIMATPIKVTVSSDLEAEVDGLMK